MSVIAWGLTLLGLNAKSAPEIKLELEASLKAGPLGASAGSEPDGSIPVASLAGQLIAILTDGYAGLWDLLLAIYANTDPASATGAALDMLCALTGTTRRAATRSTVTETCTGKPGTILPTARVVTVQVSGTRFLSLAQGTIVALDDWTTLHAYALGARVTNGSSPARAYLCIFAGTSAAYAPGPLTTDPDIVDGTAQWRYLGDGTGAVDVAYAAEVTGVLAAVSGTLSVIGTPVNGWSGAINIADAVKGTDVELDPALRLRRQAELAAEGAGDSNAIRAAVLRVDVGTVNAVVSCRVFVNNTILASVDGLPPKSIEVLVLGGLDADIAAVLFAEVAAGIETFGTTSVNVTDSNGDVQVVKFTRPTPVPIYVRVDITYDPAVYPAADIIASGELIKTLVGDYGQAFPVGRSVRASLIEAAVIDGPEAPPGILDVTALYIGVAPAPGSSATVAITSRQLATFNSANVVVNFTPGSP